MRRDGKGPVVPPSDSELHRDGGGGNSERINDEEQKIGLIIRERRKAPDRREQNGFRAPTPPASEVEDRSTPPAASADEAARRALLASLNSSDSTSQQTANANLTIALNEEEALQQDMEERPNAPTLETYSAIPVEGFGAAMLRGMGWKEGMGAGKKRDGPSNASLVKKRPELLGLGAKERSVTPSAGVGGKGGSQPRRERPEMKYMPLVKRETGGGSRSGSVSASASGSGYPSRSGSESRDAGHVSGQRGCVELDGWLC